MLELKLRGWRPTAGGMREPHYRSLSWYPCAATSALRSLVLSLCRLLPCVLCSLSLLPLALHLLVPLFVSSCLALSCSLSLSLPPLASRSLVLSLCFLLLPAALRSC